MMSMKDSQLDKFLGESEKNNATVPGKLLNDTRNSCRLTARHQLIFLNEPSSAEAELNFLIQDPTHLCFIFTHRDQQPLYLLPICPSLITSFCGHSWTLGTLQPSRVQVLYNSLKTYLLSSSFLGPIYLRDLQWRPIIVTDHSLLH